MQRFFKSAFNFSWAMTELGMKGVGHLAEPSRRRAADAADALDGVTEAGRGQLGGRLGGLFETGDRWVRRWVDRLFDALTPPGGRAAHRGPLDPSVFVVVGDDLAAGMGHFGIESTGQRNSFPALLAAALDTPLPQPLFEPPGIGGMVGLPEQPVVVPGLMQSTVLEELPTSAGYGNLAVPGHHLADALRLRPQAPLVDRESAKQTLTNFILGMPRLTRSPVSGPTQAEYARRRRPTLALVAIGFRQAVETVLAGRAEALPSTAEFGRDFRALLDRLGPRPTIVATTIPDPIDTAYFSDRDTAAKILKTLPSFLEEQYAMAADAWVTLPGLVEIGYQMMNREVGRLPFDPMLSGDAAAGLRQGVCELNAAIVEATRRAGGLVYDLHGVIRAFSQEGADVAGRHLTGDYLGGLYLLNGLFPGATGNALIADGLVGLLNRELGQSFAGVPVEQIAASDANTLSELAPGEPATEEFLRPRTAGDLPQLPPLTETPVETPILTTYPQLDPAKAGCTPTVGVPAGGYSDPGRHDPGQPPLELPLELPPGLEQTLDVNPEGSYFGDALRALDCPNDPTVIPGLPSFGLCGAVFFGGPVLTSAPLRGKVHVVFSPPDENNVSHFEIRHPGGLVGDDADLVAPQLFKMRSQYTVIQDIPELPSSGDLHLDTGRVTNLHYNLRNWNTALATLFGINPNLPGLKLLFPGPPNAGSTWARFEPRGDGRLDLTLAANTFVPLGRDWQGEPVRFALPFGTPGLRTASFLARGTSLHPRIHVTTRELPAGEPEDGAPEIPENSVREMTVVARQTSFGDEFELRAPELGERGATGRSHLLGRVRAQFGAHSGTSAPVYLRVLPPGGLLSDAPRLPPFMPPGVTRGLIGFDAVLRFPQQTYDQSGLASADDPFNLSVGNVDLRTGRIVDELLFRGFVVQALFGDLIQVEPCTPADSFNYQGLAAFEEEPAGQTAFRFNGTVYVPYPEGFRFPSPAPGGRPPFVIGPDSRLDPFRRIRASFGGAAFDGRLEGEADEVVSSVGTRFSYRYALPGRPADGPAEFEYTDHDRGATFCLESLAWIDFARVRGAGPEEGPPQIVTFTGFGSWSGDREDALHQVSVQISTAPGAEYVGIQVDGGATSNVDTKPTAIEETYA